MSSCEPGAKAAHVGNRRAKVRATQDARHDGLVAPRAAPETTAVAAPTCTGPTDLAATATHLAEELQKSLAVGRLDVLPAPTVQALMTAACRLYAAHVEAGQQYLPVANVTSTDLMVTASGLLKAGNLAVFELGMWQSWTGR